MFGKRRCKIQSLISIPKKHPLVSCGTLFKPVQTGHINLLANDYQLPTIILGTARKKKQIIYGARAMNMQLPMPFQRPTEDYDIYARKPKQSAHNLQQQLDLKIAGGRDEFYSKPAIHKGTHKVMHQGADARKGTEDDIPIADFTQMPTSVPTTNIGGIKYETVGSIKKRKKEILQDPESEYRHEKDTEDLERIRLSKIYRGRIF